MEIRGIENMTFEEVANEIQRGGRFVVYQYCISLAIVTFKRGSEVYFLKADDSPINAGIAYSLISFVMGWWGIPWGPIYTIQTIINNCRGGIDVTNDIYYQMSQRARANTLEMWAE